MWVWKRDVSLTAEARYLCIRACGNRNLLPREGPGARASSREELPLISAPFWMTRVFSLVSRAVADQIIVYHYYSSLMNTMAISRPTSPGSERESFDSASLSHGLG